MTYTRLLEKKIDKDLFVDSILQLAYSGDMQAIGLVMRYLEGPPESEEKPETETNHGPEIHIYIPDNHREAPILEDSVNRTIIDLVPSDDRTESSR